METAQFDISWKTVHIKGKCNQIADSLSRWFVNKNCQKTVYEAIQNPIWDIHPNKKTCH